MDWQQILLTFIANPATWATLAFIVFVVLLSRWKKAAIIRDAAIHAYHIVEGLQQSGTLPKSLTKEAAALQKFVELLEAQNYKVTDAAVDLAKLLWASFAAQHNEVPAAAATVAASVAAAAHPPS
jgi:hypothetical protein